MLDPVVRGRPQRNKFYLIADGMRWMIDNVGYGDSNDVSLMFH